MLAFLLSASLCAAPVDWPVLTLTQVAFGSTHPTQITTALDGSDRLFVVEQAGHIQILKNGAFLSTPFLDISMNVISGGPYGEQGMLSVAFPPNYTTKRYFYTSYTRAPDGATVISRFSLTADNNVADPASEQVILTIPQPVENHKSGQLAFGPDGYLYIGVGDGDGEGDFNNTAQTTLNLLGKILRIDTESDVTPYAVPPTNPFVNNPAYKPEIWALGLRNPWRFSFDRQTGDLYIGDVGQDSWEEVDFQPAGSAGGQNYGWSVMEGFSNYRVPAGFDLSTLTAPAIAYDHNRFNMGGRGVIGGFVYRGPPSSRMDGLYVFGDYYLGTISGMKYDGVTWQYRRLVLDGTIQTLSSFGEDEAGNIYAVDYTFGAIYSISDNRVVHAPTATPPGGTYNAPTNVQLISDPGATIYYTLDGTTPTTSSPSVLSGSTILISPGQQLKTFAVRAGFTDSATTSISYTFQAGTPQFSPALVALPGPTQISITTITPGAVIHYTTDGTTPAASSPVYSAPITVTPPKTVQALAVRSGYQDSTTSSIFYGLSIRENVMVTTVAGGTQGYTDGPISTAKFWLPYGLCLDANGLLYLVDTGNNAIRTITPAGQVTTLAGGTSGFVNGLGTSAKFAEPEGICFGPDGNLYVTDVNNFAVRMVTPSGQVSTVASGTSKFTSLNVGILFNRSGSLFVADWGRIKTVAGGSSTIFAGPGAGNINTGWQVNPGIALGPSGNFYVSNTSTALSTVSPSGTITAFAGSSAVGYSDGPVAAALFRGVGGAICCDVLGNLYVCDWARIRKITPSGIISTLAGGNTTGFTDGPGSSATFGSLTGICVSPQGVVYVSDYSNNAIRKIVQADPYPGFKVTSFVPDGHGGMAVSWPTVSGVNYQIQYSTDLINWQNVGATVNGDGTTKTINDDALTGITRRFYRAAVVSP